MKAKYMRTIPLLIISCLTLATVALAAPAAPTQANIIIPPIILKGPSYSYQGKLTQTGRAANGSFDFQFRLFDAATGGTQVGTTCTVSTVDVQNGLFTALVAFGLGVIPGQDASYLDIAVRPHTILLSPYTTLSPRQRITPAPYAVSAANADRATTATCADQLTPARRTIKIPASALACSAANRSGSGILFPSDFAPSASAMVPMPEDWDGKSDFTVSLLFWPTNNNAGTIKFFTRITGAFFNGVCSDPGSTTTTDAVTVSNSMRRLYRQRFTIPAARFLRQEGSADAIHIYGIQRQGDAAHMGTETYTSNVELLAVEIAYTAVR